MLYSSGLRPLMGITRELRTALVKSMVEKLAKAPIHEAIIDIQCQLSQEVLVDNLKFNNLGRREPVYLLKTESNIDDATGLAQSIMANSCLGYKYTDSDSGIVGQFRMDRATTSKIRPYDSWETFLPQAVANWNRYKEVTGADINSVTCVAVRYINRLLAPFDNNDPLIIQDYLKNAPARPSEIGRSLEDFLCRMVLPVPEIDSKVILTSTREDIVREEDNEFLPIILDIDVFHLVPENKLESDEKMWSIIEDMRTVKNEMFFNVMTEKALELCR